MMFQHPRLVRHKISSSMYGSKKQMAHFRAAIPPLLFMAEYQRSIERNSRALDIFHSVVMPCCHPVLNMTGFNMAKTILDSDWNSMRMTVSLYSVNRRAWHGRSSSSTPTPTRSSAVFSSTDNLFVNWLISIRLVISSPRIARRCFSLCQFWNRFHRRPFCYQLVCP
jgi:hypothetical protein